MCAWGEREALIFRDRRAAGAALAAAVLQNAAPSVAPLVLALPRGGVPVGFEVAEKLHADLDVFLVRKLGLPGQEELAMGAIASGGVRVLNEALVRQLRLSPKLIDAAAHAEGKELERRELLYREGRPALPLEGRDLILVDDGLATGASMRAAIQAVKPRKPRRILVAVPVAAPQTCRQLAEQADRIVCLRTPAEFSAVGSWYEHFPQVSDDEVKLLLEAANARSARTPLY